MDMTTEGRAAFLELAGIGKRYGGITALDEVDFRAARGSIHAILGENGAGKSTLMKILAGAVRPDTGELRVDSRPLRFDGPGSALDAGIVCVFQELSLVPHLSVAENICLANPPRNRLGLIDVRRQRAMAEAALARIGCEGIDVRERCADLPLSQRQLVEIAKALHRRPRVLILDEATSALGADDVARLVTLLKRLRDEGTCVLFISHRMHEVDALADTCSVFRNGRHVATFPAGSKPHEEIVAMMIGRSIDHVYPPKPDAPPAGTPYLDARDLSWNGVLKGVTLQVQPGEIVGLGGLDGQGQRELLLALAGLLRGTQGTVRIGEHGAPPQGPKQGKRDGCRLALIPEDRKTEGLLLGRSIRDNLVVAALDRLARGGTIDRAAEQRLVDELIRTLQIKAPDPHVAVSTLSGGNQQKVVLAKWLATRPRLLLLMDPTRGVDVGTKQEIYRLFRRLADEGMAIFVHSTDCDELIGLCDRVLVMYDGRLRAELAGASLTEQAILMNAMNLDTPARPAAPRPVATEVPA